MRYGQLFIIPNENQILGGVFQREVKSNHLVEIQHFVDYYHLGYQFQGNEYHDAPCRLARDGHLVIKTVEDSGNFICYIPEVVTDDQSMWFYQNRELMKKYFMCGAYCVKGDKENYQMEEVEGFDNIMELIQKRNILYQRTLNRNMDNQNFFHH